MLSKEIKVIGVDEIRTHSIEPNNPINNVYFELSLVPSSEWKDIFEQQTSKKMTVDGRHVVVKALIGEIEGKLAEVRREVTKTNQKYQKVFKR